ncbi:hypothetical protein DLE01_21415, partial [Streptomyces sp. FT05W]
DLAGATWVFTTMAIVSALAALPTLSPVIRKLAPPEHYVRAFKPIPPEWVWEFLRNSRTVCGR